jgi:pyruvate/2-oxoglutarate/acetoin dehydrogenase E1 component
MAYMTMVEAVNDALQYEMGRDERIVVLGEDVGLAGGVFRATAGLLGRYGGDRVVDTPLSEAAIVGASVGLALNGMRPIPEIQFDAFVYPAFEQIAVHVSRYRWRTRGRAELAITLRIPYGGGIRAPELHSDSPEAFFTHLPGVKVVVPATPTDAKGLLTSAIRDPDPVIVLEPKAIYRTMKEDVPEGSFTTPIGEARTARAGSDLTLVAWGAMVPRCLEASERLAPRHEVEVLDLRTLSPLDSDAVVASVERTGRAVVVHEAPRSVGVGAEVAAVIQERALLSLEAPVARVTGWDTSYPYFSLEESYMPSVDRIVAACRRTLEF